MFAYRNSRWDIIANTEVTFV